MTITTMAIEVPRDPKGKFLPGASANPGGRPRDAGAARRLREALTGAAPAAALTLAKAAKAGDIKAAVALLGFVMPGLKPVSQAEPIKLRGSTATAKAESIIAAVAAGELAPDQARELVAALVDVGRLRELDQLEQRIQALEASTRARP